MRNWMDLNGDGEIDSSEMMFAGEMLCTSREEHEALFGDAGDFEDDAKDDFEIDAMAAGLDVDELELMDPDDRAEVLEEEEFEPMFASCESKLSGKRIALFGSYGWGDGQWMRDWEDRMKAAGAEVACGEGIITQETPDDDALVKCKELGKTLAAV